MRRTKERDDDIQTVDTNPLSSVVTSMKTPLIRAIIFGFCLTPAACSSGSGALSVHDACVEINRQTLTATPVSEVPPPSTDPNIKAAGQLSRRLAQRVQDATFRSDLIAVAGLAASKTWLTEADWLNAPAVQRIGSRCRRELQRRG
jgi:hypothetical protein